MEVSETKRSLSEFRFQFSFLLMILAGSMAIFSAEAQTTGQGTITGTAADPTGAVIVGASVSVVNVETNVGQDTITNSTGYFEVNNLNPGTYRIQVSAGGFLKLMRNGVTLDVAAHVNVPLTLRPGSATGTVTVTADASLLNTESGSSGQVLTTRQLEELPVSGSSPTWLELIAPGVQGKTGQAASPVTVAACCGPASPGISAATVTSASTNSFSTASPTKPMAASRRSTSRPTKLAK